MNKQLNWAALGCGTIAGEMAQVLREHGRTFYGVANRTHSKAVSFAAQYGVGKVYDDIDALFADPAVDAVYVATPHNTHYRYIRQALESGKHVLAEKAITLNSRELAELTALAGQCNLMLGEAMTIWHMPLYKLLREQIGRGDYGQVRMITANFGSLKEYDPQNRFFNLDLAGGALLDIGVYALSAVRAFLDTKPDTILSQWNPAPTGSDESSAILLRNPEGQLATVSLSLLARQPKRIMISCEKGYLEIMNYPRADHAVYTDGSTGARTEISAGTSADALYYEVLDMEEAVAIGDATLLHLQDSTCVMEIMTRLREDWGLRYPEE